MYTSRKGVVMKNLKKLKYLVLLFPVLYFFVVPFRKVFDTFPYLVKSVYWTSFVLVVYYIVADFWRWLVGFASKRLGKGSEVEEVEEEEDGTV